MSEKSGWGKPMKHRKYQTSEKIKPKDGLCQNSTGDTNTSKSDQQTQESNQHKVYGYLDYLSVRT